MNKFANSPTFPYGMKNEIRALPVITDKFKESCHEIN